MRPLVLVGKADCPLCDEAREVVARVAAEFGLEAERVDVASEPGLERYRDQVPVVLWKGRPVAKLRVREGVLRRRLKEESEAARDERA
ncbi:MAG: glutaredoxin family protein [Halobacteria archaeon]